VVSGQWSVRAFRNTLLRFKHTWNRKNQAEDFVSRYRRGWDAGVTADWPGNGAGIRDSAASTRADANWDCCAASLTVDITKSL